MQWTRRLGTVRTMAAAAWGLKEREGLTLLHILDAGSPSRGEDAAGYLLTHPPSRRAHFATLAAGRWEIHDGQTVNWPTLRGLVAARYLERGWLEALNTDTGTAQRLLTESAGDFATAEIWPPPGGLGRNEVARHVWKLTPAGLRAALGIANGRGPE